MKIMHIGVYDRNIGDNIAIRNLQRSIGMYIPDVQVVGLDLQKIWETDNSPRYMRALYDDFVRKGIDAIVVGGGGLLEFGGYEHFHSKWKLPFYEETLKFIEIPILFYGVGVNIFRGGIEYSPSAKKALQDTINQSKAFGIRNDGSYDKLKNWIGLDVSKVDIVPDPGLLHLDRFNIERKQTVSVLGFQPAINKSKGINNNRFVNEFNLGIIRDYFRADITLPHTISDFQFGHPVIPKREFINKYRVFENLDKFLGKYKLVDYVIAMRGHGQMISIGLNIPGIYLSTQDKVRDFSVNNGFENYDVDIREPNWFETLKLKRKLLTEKDSTYLKEWYEIRDKFIADCHTVDKNWIEKNFKL